MKIKNYLNTSDEVLKTKQHNIFVPVSLGNKSFTRELLKQEILWALENTLENVAILIGDKLQAINYEVRSGYSEARAQKVTTRKGEEIKRMIMEIIAELPLQQQQVVCTLKWADIETESYHQMLTVLLEEFKTNPKFKSTILDIVHENTESVGLTDQDTEKLCYYPLTELPVFISGFENKGVVYDLQIYPGVGKVDYLAIDLQEGKTFPSITQRLNLKTKLQIIESYTG